MSVLAKLVDMDANETRQWLARHRPNETPAFKDSYTQYDQGRKFPSDRATILRSERERLMVSKQKRKALCRYNGRFFYAAETFYGLHEQDMEALAIGSVGTVGGLTSLVSGVCLFGITPFGGTVATAALGFVATFLTLIGAAGSLIGALLMLLMIDNITDPPGGDPTLDVTYMGNSREALFLRACSESMWPVFELTENKEVTRVVGSEGAVHYLRLDDGALFQEGDVIDYLGSERDFKEALLRNDLLDTYREQFGEPPEAFDPETGEIIEPNQPLPTDRTLPGGS